MNTDLTHDTTNNTMTKDGVLKSMGGFGRAYGKGQNSRPAAAQIAVCAANKGVFGAKDAKEVYTAFSEAAAASQGIEFKATSSFGVQVSKMKQFLLLGGLAAIDGEVVFNDAYDAIGELSRRDENPLKGSAYDALVKVARRQIAQPKVQLTKDDITSILTETPDEKSELDKVIELYKRTYNVSAAVAEAGEDNQNMEDALELLADQIKAMGGELPAMTKEDREVQKAQETLRKHGLATPAEFVAGTAEIVGTLVVNQDEETEDKQVA